MSDVVNLNRFRKKKKRAEKEKTAAENRARFGRRKDETERAAADRETLRRRLDGARREDKSGDGDNGGEDG